MTDDARRLDHALYRIHGLEQVAAALGAAIEQLVPGFGAKALTDIRTWSEAEPAVSLLSQHERDAVVDAFEETFGRKP